MKFEMQNKEPFGNQTALVLFKIAALSCQVLIDNRLKCIKVKWLGY
jgi:hypothetical protein